MLWICAAVLCWVMIVLIVVGCCADADRGDRDMGAKRPDGSRDTRFTRYDDDYADHNDHVHVG